MKSYKLTTATLIALNAFFVVVGVNGQGRSQIEADIPFDFQVNGKPFASGAYFIEQADRTTNNRTIIIRRKDGKDVAIVQMLPLAADDKRPYEKPLLVFARNESTNALTEVRMPSAGLFGRLRNKAHGTNAARTSEKPERRVVHGT